MSQSLDKAERKLEKSGGVANFRAKAFASVNVVPLYQTDSKSAFAEQFAGQEMKLQNFQWVLDRLTATSEVKAINFLGGEPTKWQYIDEAIFLARQKNFKTEIIAEKIQPMKKSLPDRINLNLQNFLHESAARPQIESTLDFYRKSRVPIDLSFFVSEKNLSAEKEELVRKLAKKVGANLRIRPSYFDQKLNCQNCIYTRLTIQPDGDTVSLCRFLPITAKLSDYLSLEEMYEKALQQEAAKQTECLAGRSKFSERAGRKKD